MKKNSKIADFLGNFMKNDGERSGKAKRNTDEKAAGNGGAIDKIMQTIADKIHKGERMGMISGGWNVTMTPGDKFFNNKEGENAG